VNIQPQSKENGGQTRIGRLHLRNPMTSDGGAQMEGAQQPAGAIAPLSKRRTQPIASPSHPLDRMNHQRLAKKLVVFNPSLEVIEDLRNIASRTIGQLAHLDVIEGVMSHNPDNFWAIACSSKFNYARPQAGGFVAFLMLNARGMNALRTGNLDPANPDRSFLAPQNEKPACIYVWALYAPGPLAGGISLVFNKISAPQYKGVDLYARPATENGYQFLQTIGFCEDETSTSGLYVFARQERASSRPSYDTYRSSRSENAQRLSVTVVHSMEDLSRVLSIRSAVYIAEQYCPYEEEFDGNDYACTHLLGYAGSEPAGCLRIRFFADFAKIERLAVRSEFRKTRLAFELVRAGIELGKMKGYGRFYGHAQQRLVNFWSRFGFRPLDGDTLVFSDFDYREMVLDTNRHPDAIAIESDPYKIIRPEGRWHEPGILERSAARPVTRPSAESRARPREDITPIVFRG
jgi:predicted GNAT family N-acyltransferase